MKYKKHILAVVSSIVLVAAVLAVCEVRARNERADQNALEAWEVQCINGKWLDKPFVYQYRTSMIERRWSDDDGTRFLRLKTGTVVIVGVVGNGKNVGGAK